MTADKQILKGETFVARLRDVCAKSPSITPLENLKYKRILMPGLVGGEDQFALLGFVGQALRMRGAEVIALCCDKFLPACCCKKVDHYESACDRWCYKNIVPFLETVGLPHRWYSEFITPEDVSNYAELASRVDAQAIEEFTWDGLELGEHILRSVENYFKVGGLNTADPAMVAKAKEFVHAAICLVHVSRRALDELGIDKVFVNDGRKNDWGIIRTVAVECGIPVDISLYGQRGGSVTFESYSPPRSFDSLLQWPAWSQQSLNAKENQALDAYMQRRATRPFESRSVYDHTQRHSLEDIRSQIGLPGETAGLVFGMFPNMSYDGGLTSNKPAYATAAQWVADTIRYFKEKPEHTLVVKIHPAEHLRLALDPTIDYLKSEIGSLPNNVRIIEPETTMVAQDVLQLLDVVMVYTSTVAVEAAYYGKPVIMVGGGCHGGRGLTIDASSPAQFFEILDQMCSGILPDAVPSDMARRYAYAVFFRNILPITHVDSHDLEITSINLESLDDLAPGRDETIDTICRGILLDEPFEYTAWNGRATLEQG